jgi:hypothetical protein
MSQRVLLLAVNAIGGLAVLASYAHGISSPHAASGAIWGGVPASAQGLYTTSMFTAAIGYFPFTYLFAFHSDPARARIGGASLNLVSVLYAFVLIPSAMWLPLTAQYLDAPSESGWIAIQATLAAVALGSAGLFISILRLEPRPPRKLRLAALTGCTFFCFQTVVLDAVVWVMLFPR